MDKTPSGETFFQCNRNRWFINKSLTILTTWSAINKNKSTNCSSINRGQGRQLLSFHAPTFHSSCSIELDDKQPTFIRGITFLLTTGSRTIVKMYCTPSPRNLIANCPSTIKRKEYKMRLNTSKSYNILYQPLPHLVACPNPSINRRRTRTQAAKPFAL